MATKQARGTKRTCQNSECGSRFYDLANSPIVCPICLSTYVIASAPAMAEAIVEDLPKPNKEFADAGAVVPEDAPEVEAEGLADIEPAEAVAAPEDETFLEEEEEDGGDVTGILGGVAEDEEEP